MIQYSDSSGEEEESATTASSPSAKVGRGTPPQSEETKAKVRFRYSRGTAGLICGTVTDIIQASVRRCCRTPGILYELIVVFCSGQFPWDRNEIVTIISTEPDGDRVLARDGRGNQQLIPKTYLTLLPAAVRSIISNND